MIRLAQLCAICLSLLSSPLVFADIALPAPHEMPATQRPISLKEAIALALRNNPTVRIAELQRVLDKFGLRVSIWQGYQPVWQPLGFTGTLQNGVAPQWGFTTGVTATAPSGTATTINYNNDLAGGAGQVGLSVTQHLMKGFHLATNMIPYKNAIDTEKIAKLTFKNSVIGVVVTVITNYRALVQAMNSYTLSQQTYNNQFQNIKRSKLEVEAGQMAPNDLLQEEANLENTHLSVVQQQDALRQTYQTFLSSLGLPSTINLKINTDISTKKLRVHSLEEATRIGLSHNIAYLQAVLKLEMTKRQLQLDEDNRRWTLDVTGTTSLGSASNDTSPSSSQLNLQLSIPFDNLTLRQAIVSDKVAIEGAKLTLQQQREDLIRQIDTQWHSIVNQEQQVLISTKLVNLQQQTVTNAQLKLRYGKTSVFEVNSLINDLLSQQINLVTEKITYLNSVTALYQTIGMTLDEWGVGLKY